MRHVRKLLMGGQGAMVQMQRLMERSAAQSAAAAPECADNAGAGDGNAQAMGLASVAEEPADVHGQDGAGSWDWMRRSGDGEMEGGGAGSSRDYSGGWVVGLGVRKVGGRGLVELVRSFMDHDCS